MSESHPTASLDELVTRFSKGDRRPSVVQALNSLAWEAFHDPWESPPPAVSRPGHSHPVLGRIAGALSRAGFAFQHLGGGRYRFPLAKPGKSPVALAILTLQKASSPAPNLILKAYVMPPLPDGGRMLAESLRDSFNRHATLLKAHLSPVKDPSDHLPLPFAFAGFEVEGEVSIPLDPMDDELDRILARFRLEVLGLAGVASKRLDPSAPGADSSPGQERQGPL